MTATRWLTLFLLLPATALAQGEPLVPGDNLVVEGVPEVPARLVEEVNPYTQFRGAGVTSWHPAKREMLIYTRFAETSQVHYVKFPGGARTQLTFFRDEAWDATFQPTRGDYFVLAKDSDGDEY